MNRWRCSLLLDKAADRTSLRTRILLISETSLKIFLNYHTFSEFIFDEIIPRILWTINNSRLFFPSFLIFHIFPHIFSHVSKIVRLRKEKICNDSLLNPLALSPSFRVSFLSRITALHNHFHINFGIRSKWPRVRENSRYSPFNYALRSAARHCAKYIYIYIYNIHIYIQYHGVSIYN